jgi:hypothetical protein
MNVRLPQRAHRSGRRFGARRADAAGRPSRQRSDADPGVRDGLLLLARGQQRQVKVMIMSGKASRLPRLVRLVVGRNQLRRPYDRTEGAVLVALAGAFLAAVAGASIRGAYLYQSHLAGAARLRQVAAVLTHQATAVNRLALVGQARARWSIPGGQERSGVLTSVTAPGIASAGMGARIPVWLNRHGQPAVPPPGQALLIFDAVLLAAAAAAGAAAGLLTIYGLCRLALDRRRLAAWESAWTLTGPRWTSRH